MPTDSNAMTEVALALAMAFFTVLILALVSMGVPAMEQMDKSAPEPVSVSTVSVNTGSGKREVETDEVLYMYYDSIFYQEDFSIHPVALISQNQKIILAVPADLSLSTLLRLQREISSPGLSITTLNQAWIDALRLQRK